MRELENIILEASYDKYGIADRRKVQMILEDAQSPVTKKYLETLYTAMLDKSHIDFGDIPASKGDITKYKGYTTIISTIDALNGIIDGQRSHNAIRYVTAVKNAVDDIVFLKSEYMAGFTKKSDYVMLEYNMIVYTIVQSLSGIIYSFIDYVKNPDTGVYDIILKNNPVKANLLYIEQLEQYHRIVKGNRYREFLKEMSNAEKDNFIGTYTAIGAATVIVVLMSIVPVMRELVYWAYTLRGTLSHALDQQAYFLSMNEANIRSNSNFTDEKKEDVINKQNKLISLLRKLSEKIRVDHYLAQDNSAKIMKSERSQLSLSSINDSLQSGTISLM